MEISKGVDKHRIYKASGNGAFSKDYGLRDQIRRASVSIMSNIAEGYELRRESGAYSVSFYCKRLMR